MLTSGNTYNIRNVSDRETRIFFAQARNLQAPLSPVVHDGRTVFSHGVSNVLARPAVDSDVSDAGTERGRTDEGTAERAPVDRRVQRGADDADEEHTDDEDAEDADVYEVSNSDADASSDDFDISRESRQSNR